MLETKRREELCRGGATLEQARAKRWNNVASRWGIANKTVAMRSDLGTVRKS